MGLVDKARVGEETRAEFRENRVASRETDSVTDRKNYLFNKTVSGNLEAHLELISRNTATHMRYV